MFMFIVVHPWERVLRYSTSGPVKVLGPGRHWRTFGARYVSVDLRSQQLHVATQEVLSADMITLRVSAVLSYRIVDPVRFTEMAIDPMGEIYVAAQDALRAALAGVNAEDATGSARAAIGEHVFVSTRSAGDQYGVEVVAVNVKDVVLPSELRYAYSEVATARQHSLAKLEEARSETAALRSLANGAKLLEDHPALAQLKLMQALPMGATVKLTLEK